MTSPLLRMLAAMAPAAGVLLTPARGGEPLADPRQRLERTAFQTGSPYNPRIDIKSDVAMVYGITGDVAGKVKGWRDAGYIIHLMTGVAWGEYQDYFEGRWDGVSHADEAQTDRNGRPILHHPTVPYVAPSETYGKYLCVGVKKAIDAGAEAVHLEEPEFWVRAGYSGSFQREWRAFYGEDWVPPHTSPDAQYRASKLKYFLYRRALQQVFDFVIDYGRQIGRQVRCYVPTHSMLNYAHWRIVSPEQSLVQLRGCDGYVGQVWTGTARTPNRYRGVLKERTFETAFLEYGSLHNLVRSTGRRMYYLNDPVEDNPDHSWTDYKRNWECTLVASLLWPDVFRYEVTPWPERPFLFKYPVKDIKERRPGEAVERVGISEDYATELLTVFNALNDMRQSRVSWDCGTQGIGVLVSDTMMFQRGEPASGDPHLGSFYGLSLPLVKSGVPVHPVQLENASLREYLKPYRVLLLTYEGMKPPSADLHDRLADWVRGGGVLVVIDDDTDPYLTVREWWNLPPHRYDTPRHHLFERLGLPAAASPGLHRVGRGAVLYASESPAALSRATDGSDRVLALCRQACEANRTPWRTARHLLLRRGPYVVAAGLDETPDGPPARLSGRFVDLFDARLRVLTTVDVSPGARILLLDLDAVRGKRTRVLASAAKVTAERTLPDGIRFHAAGPEGTTAAIRVRLPAPPAQVTVGGVPLPLADVSWDPGSQTALVRFANAPRGVVVRVRVAPSGRSGEHGADGTRT